MASQSSRTFPTFNYNLLLLTISLVLVLLIELVMSQYIGLITAGGMPKKPVKLKRLNVYEDKISLSGYSSGAGIAQQLQFSYSSLFAGIAIFGQTFYRCGPGDGIQANFDSFCTLLGNIMPDHQWETQIALDDIKEYYINGLIENPRHLQSKKLYIFAGTHNYLFSADQALKVLDVYKPFIRDNQAIRVQIWDANHTLPSNKFGGPCLDSDARDYFVGYCGISGAYEALRFIHGKAWVSNYEKQTVNLQPLLTFDQTDFFYGVQEEHYLDKIGFMYIPKKCKTSKCLVHFYFHGCRSGREFLDENHIQYSGYLQVAELNNIIMIFPQVLSNDGENQIGCWDTYGLTGPLYATRKGAQVAVIRNMIARILGEDQPKLLRKKGLKIPFLPSWEIIFPKNVNVRKVYT